MVDIVSAENAIIDDWIDSMDLYEEKISKYNKASDDYVAEMKEYDSHNSHPLHPIGMWHSISGTTVDDYVTTKLPNVKDLPEPVDSTGHSRFDSITWPDGGVGYPQSG